jgi:hypothetical protein
VEAHRLHRLARARMLRHEWMIAALNCIVILVSLALPCWVVTVTQARRQLAARALLMVVLFLGRGAGICRQRRQRRYLD